MELSEIIRLNFVIRVKEKVGTLAYRPCIVWREHLKCSFENCESTHYLLEGKDERFCMINNSQLHRSTNKYIHSCIVALFLQVVCMWSN